MTWEWRRERFVLAKSSGPIGAALTSSSATPVTMAKATGPSFDCTRALSTQERLICADDELATQDLGYANLYRRALTKSRDAEAFLQEGRRQLREREANCIDKACLLQWYAKRTAVLTPIAD